jgi:hypothetical protein
MSGREFPGRYLFELPAKDTVKGWPLFRMWDQVSCQFPKILPCQPFWFRNRRPLPNGRSKVKALTNLWVRS